MVFSLEEAMVGLSHLALGWKRRLTGQPVGKYLLQLPAESCGMRLLKADSDTATCPICGYAWASLELADGGLLQGCSATELRELLSSPKFAAWLESLPTAWESGVQKHRQSSAVP